MVKTLHTYIYQDETSFHDLATKGKEYLYPCAIVQYLSRFLLTARFLYHNHNEIILFADDTNIFVKAKSLKLAYQAANELLSQINDYMVCNKLHINLEKSCYYMHFKKYIPISSRVDSLSNDMTYNIHINNSELKKVTHT